MVNYLRCSKKFVGIFFKLCFIGYAIIVVLIFLPLPTSSQHPHSLRSSCPWVKLAMFSFIIFSNQFPISCFLSSPSGTPVMQMLGLWKLSQTLLILSSFCFFLILFSSSCSDWSFFCFLMFQIIDLMLSFIHSTVVSLYIFF